MTLLSFVADPRKGWGSKAMAIAALVYLISPIDAVPDFIPVLGLLDDAGVILATVASLAEDIERLRRVANMRHTGLGAVCRNKSSIQVTYVTIRPTCFRPAAGYQPVCGPEERGTVFA